ncbi:hypothetical protein ACOSQ2_024943 [Xanthoceras sorbifolium]|uniref:WRKY domain-containing protein n=1 Tax=Xanthoceras sorbifolium TaxID=99658 RepID=A0ABQ8H8A1_9ROSI|nr:hypothetical protein JRO89_XS13G0144900 [Xanthoceras sorbifolium]
MESGWSREQKTLISELIEGMELAKQLRVHLGTTSSVEKSDMLVQRILSSYEKALLILKWGGSTVQAQAYNMGAAANCGVPESPISINGSPRSEDFDGPLKDNLDNQESSKKRKTLPRWTDKVRVSFESGLEGPHEDGYSWRKYGQKDILGAKYPRSYYRCTYRNTQNCWATKQVQRSDDDPTIFEVTYRGTHTCSHGSSHGQSVPQPPSPEKQEQQRLNHHNSNNNNYQQQPSQDILSNLRKGLSVNTNGLDNKEMEPPFTFPSTSFGCMRSGQCFSPSMLDENTFLGFSSTYASPSTAESNYFLCQMNSFGDAQGLEANLPELLSANNSSANSPILNMDFSLDPAEMDPNFLF